MKKLGYVVSKRKINDVLDFVGVVNNIKDIDDPTKPFIVIGMNNAKELIPNFSILNKKIDDNVFWTFSKTERRIDYEKDLNNFYNIVLENCTKKLKYYYVNILTIKYNKVKKLLNIVNSDEKKYIYISKDMIYIYYNNYILGISISILKYINVNIKNIINKIKSNKNNIVKTNDSFLSLKMKNAIINKKYVIPYFMSIFDD